MQTIKKNKQPIGVTIIVILTASILVGIGAIITSEIAKDMPNYPTDAFVIVKKESIDQGWWIFPDKEYYFFFGNGTYDYFNVPQSNYNQYNVGDLYPNTEPHYLNADTPAIPLSYEVIILSISACIIAGTIGIIMWKRNRE